MVCLGADSIVMDELGELTPIDPRTANEFNPIDPLNPKRRVPIGVEDVRAFFDLAKEQGLKGPAVREAFQKLATEIHPLALGNVKRITQLIQFLSKRILATHLTEEATASAIASALTRERFSHTYFINAAEAIELGLPVEAPEPELEEALWDLHLEYEADMGLLIPFDPQDMISSLQPGQFVFQQIPGLTPEQNQTLEGQVRAYVGSLPLRASKETSVAFDVCYIESLKRTDRDCLTAVISLVAGPTGDQLVVRPKETWYEEVR